jgi:hypothetical protein
MLFRAGPLASVLDVGPSPRPKSGALFGHKVDLDFPVHRRAPCVRFLLSPSLGRVRRRPVAECPSNAKLSMTDFIRRAAQALGATHIRTRAVTFQCPRPSRSGQTAADLRLLFGTRPTKSRPVRPVPTAQILRDKPYEQATYPCFLRPLGASLSRVHSSPAEVDHDLEIPIEGEPRPASLFKLANDYACFFKLSGEEPWEWPTWSKDM